MNSIVSAISNATQQAIAASRDSCSADLQVYFLGVDGTRLGTVFDTSHRNFIFNFNGNVPLVADLSHAGLLEEQGANAIEDLVTYAPWRPDACRAILYISDEELDSIQPIGDFDNEDLITQNAIVAARKAGVTIFTHYITAQNRDSRILQNYNDLTSQTGGFNLTTASYNDVNPQLYIALMPSIVCNACNSCTLRKYLEE